ncbi:MAG: thioredoxin fold domain-containing protein [Chitinispirillaceae bacterium]|nr:thioredoxin fold domain-containing protein [Chitinispirillaceae bacterium]
MLKKLSKNITATGLVIITGLAIIIYAVATNQSSDQPAAKTNSLVEPLSFNTFKAKICDCGLDNGVQGKWKYKGKLPAVIDFYADWCGPCKMVSPVLEELAVEYKGRVKIYKVNTETNRELAGMFGIGGIPSILFIPPAGMPQMSSGALSKKQFKQAFNEIFGIKDAAL